MYYLALPCSRDRIALTARRDRFPLPFNLRRLHLSSGREASLFFHLGSGDNHDRSINFLGAIR
jgi:hypothetical protein